MRPETRLIAVLAVISILGVVFLGVIAQRYAGLQKVVGEEAPAGAADVDGLEAAIRDVDGFFRVRSELRQRIDAGVTETAALRHDREQAVRRSGLSPAAYLRMRDRYRAWRSGEAVEEPWATALERYRDRLDSVDLGERETLDP